MSAVIVIGFQYEMGAFKSKLCHSVDKMTQNKKLIKQTKVIIFSVCVFYTHKHNKCLNVSVCVSVLCLTWLSDSGSQWNRSRSMRLSPGEMSVCRARSLCVRVCVSVFNSQCVCVREGTHARSHVSVCASLFWSVDMSTACRSVACQTFLPTVSPGRRFSTRVPRVSMCNNDYLHLNHKEQENPDNTEETPTPRRLQPLMKYGGRICSAQHSLG